MNVAAHQEKKKNEKTKTGMKKAEDERRQTTDFRKAVCSHSGGSIAKKWLNGSRRVPGVSGTLGKANNHFDLTQTGLGTHHHVETAVDWCR